MRELAKWTAALGAAGTLWFGCSGGSLGDGAGASNSAASGTGAGAGATTGSSDPAGSGAGNSGGATTSSGVGGGKTPVFETDIVPIFQKSCGAGDNACHARVAYGANQNADCRGWLTLENAPLGAEYYGGNLDGQATGCPDLALYERLVQLDAWQECGSFRKKYIVPCDVDASYLFDKVDDGPYCEDTPGGKPSLPMPNGVAMDPGQRETLRAWILAGTPRLNGGTVNCGSGAGGAGGGQVGQAPSASINHPGDGETRKVDVPIPFIGVGTDVEDGDIPGASLVWESSLDGPIGSGASFDAVLTTVGTHVLTLTATDSDGNLGTDSLTLMMEP